MEKLSEDYQHVGGKYITIFSTAKDLFELRSLVLDVLNKIGGLTDFSFVRSVVGVQENPLITNPKEQLNIYFKEEYQRDDFIVQYAAQDINPPTFASQVYGIATRAHIRTSIFDRNAEILKLNRLYGFYDYFCVRTKSLVKQNGKNTKILFAVTQRYVEPNELRKIIAPLYNDILCICDAIDYVTIKNFPEYVLSSSDNLDVAIRLGKLETLYLTETVIKGKKPKQVAQMYNVSVNSIYQTLSRARAKLGVGTNIEAVKVAEKHGMFADDI